MARVNTPRILSIAQQKVVANAMENGLIQSVILNSSSSVARPKIKQTGVY